MDENDAKKSTSSDLVEHLQDTLANVSTAYALQRMTNIEHELRDVLIKLQNRVTLLESNMEACGKVLRRHKSEIAGLQNQLDGWQKPGIVEGNGRP
jgi:hypothetical protein